MTEDFREPEAPEGRERSAHTKTPGAMLHEARRNKNLKLEDVAKQLRLSQQWIKDIEKDDYSHAAALIYVRGYLRAYARFVGVSPDDVIAAFETLAMDEEFARVKSLQEKPVRRQAVPVISKSTRMMSRQAVQWITAAAFGVLVILGGIWWQGQKKHAGLNNVQQVAVQPKEDLPLQSNITPSADDKTVHGNAPIAHAHEPRLPRPKASALR